ncbi:L-type lectin-domain containing receptor kinase IV.3 [Capsicum annuum]|uniref:non-specific serine/threonine protein kinase n=1 Tax=Capsicum annuum TaxID=4072 RepID=A0A1U8E4Z6_CAPAN|nr:L-type lectin-domain containing receptor kinase IV.1 [Capsicum annuum]KAF3635840.1 L-type lectin-domain containing receptor kinase IV.3 [Capsicum annuum]KAF3684628.1 L-type lectin-domain containing receptor kinase IV.3 [Capsicum annuum]PHT72331.1 L-type lectin-domain containing receptor kinase IV.3 [Capsicum annuum]
MFFKIVALIVPALFALAASEELGFIYNGFNRANLSLDGIAQLTSNGLLQLTNTSRLQKGHAFSPTPINFKNLPNGSNFSFSTTFVFAIVPSVLPGHGMAFVIAPVGGLAEALPSPFLGLFNDNTTGKVTNHVFAVEFDTLQNREFNDIDGNHVGIDINGLKSVESKTAGYYTSNHNVKFNNMTLASGQPMQGWVDYDGVAKQINVTLAPMNVEKPNAPLLSSFYDLSPILNETMYIGFSGSTGSVVSTQYILGWSFKMNGLAQDLDLARLPKLPRVGPKKQSKLLLIALPMMSAIVVVIAFSVIIYYFGRKRKFAELLEDWELEYGPHRFKYKDLYIATNGFANKELLGCGGFGRVYRGVLPTSSIEIAVKKVSHESKQGLREFVAEIVSIGRLCHRNLVPLLGYCRRKGELLLVYEYMPNGSLDKFLYDKPICALNWNQRFRVIKGVALALVYLHEEWEQVVIHRDVKASNVLLDSDLNAKLGDFGLARLYDHGTDPLTTHVVGTVGYLAPEQTRTGKATTISDVYAFGAFLLEVACGRRPIDPRVSDEDIVLVDYVFSCWNRGDILLAIDQNLGNEFVKEEVELVLKLGLVCSQTQPTARPSMRQVLIYLEDIVPPPLPELSSLQRSTPGFTFPGFDHHVFSADKELSYPSSDSDSFPYTGR